MAKQKLKWWFSLARNKMIMGTTSLEKGLESNGRSGAPPARSLKESSSLADECLVA
jgi:hypothetical protein